MDEEKTPIEEKVYAYTVGIINNAEHSEENKSVEEMLKSAGLKGGIDYILSPLPPSFAEAYPVPVLWVRKSNECGNEKRTFCGREDIELFLKRIQKENERSSRFYVCLEYSLDYVKDESEKSSRLRKGGDIVTSILNKLEVPYSISFATDFHWDEPMLMGVTQRGEDGKEYELYNRWGDFWTPVCGDSVLRKLVSLGVIKNVR